MFPSPEVPRSYIPQSLYSPAPFFPNDVCLLFPSSYVPQNLCSLVLMFSRPFLRQSWYSPEEVSLPKDIPQPLCSPVPTVSRLFVPQSICSLKMLPRPYVSQSQCSLELFPSPVVPQRFLCPGVPLCSGVQISPSTDVPHNGFPVSMLLRISPVPVCHTQSRSSLKVFYSSYVPQRCPGVTMFTTSQSRCSPEVFSGPRVLQRYFPVPMFLDLYIHSPDILQTRSFLVFHSLPR